MSFLWPLSFVALSVLPLAVLLYLRMQQRRRGLALRYGDLGQVQKDAQRGSIGRRHVPAIFFLAGLVVLLLAMARPQMVLGLPKMEGTVILAFDVSGSMSAGDFEPTRMEAAKTVAKEFVARQPRAIQIGIIAFSEGGLAVQQPSNDQEVILASIDRLQPQRGTSIASGIIIALNTIANAAGDPPIIGVADDGQQPAETPTPVPAGSENTAVIVLLTDGENNMNPDPFDAARLAADRGVRIHAIGIGSASGSVLNIDGFSVFTRLDESTLQQIAGITDGLYFNAENQEDLRSIYEEIDPLLVVKREESEVTAIFAGLGILLLLIGGMLSLLWFSHFP